MLAPPVLVDKCHVPGMGFVESPVIQHENACGFVDQWRSLLQQRSVSGGCRCSKRVKASWTGGLFLRSGSSRRFHTGKGGLRRQKKLDVIHITDFR